MNRIEKYAHLDIELPELPEVLLNTIQSEILEIMCVDKNCDKFKKVCLEYPVLKDAVYVVFSNYVKKSDHKYEKFIFLGEKGNELCDLSGRDFELYGLLKCVSIPHTQEYCDFKKYS
ncbi:hypothetical protein FJR48_07075 [Sulfurimonas lithotrophica]|uniref:Uncharacterized protein n=1 Tax=Sulfurimonas lithotrophica TaxID=2590022 RepID=A0A5P8P1G8_9BACT|nr:hypothetical protein [Sulfurimonas lithotrophica]QFR49505.1 hypothetical protein FJR48_07075 [Sulfurimonas lithotrophica]